MYCYRVEASYFKVFWFCKTNIICPFFIHSSLTYFIAGKKSIASKFILTNHIVIHQISYFR